MFSAIYSYEKEVAKLIKSGILANKKVRFNLYVFHLIMKIHLCFIKNHYNYRIKLSFFEDT